MKTQLFMLLMSVALLSGCVSGPRENTMNLDMAFNHFIAGKINNNKIDKDVLNLYYDKKCHQEYFDLGYVDSESKYFEKFIIKFNSSGTMQLAYPSHNECYSHETFTKEYNTMLAEQKELELKAEFYKQMNKTPPAFSNGWFPHVMNVYRTELSEINDKLKSSNPVYNTVFEAELGEYDAKFGGFKFQDLRMYWEVLNDIDSKIDYRNSLIDTIKNKYFLVADSSALSSGSENPFYKLLDTYKLDRPEATTKAFVEISLKDYIINFPDKKTVDLINNFKSEKVKIPLSLNYTLEKCDKNYHHISCTTELVSVDVRRSSTLAPLLSSGKIVPIKNKE